MHVEDIYIWISTLQVAFGSRYTSLDNMSLSEKYRVIAVLDGECVVCSGFARFIAYFCPEARLMWAQHPVTRKFLEEFSISFDDVMQSIVVVKDGTVFRGSNAFVQILSVMPWYFQILSVIISLFPFFIREPVYRLVARYRYSLFGRKDSCSLPSPALKSKFLHPV